MNWKMNFWDVKIFITKIQIKPENNPDPKDQENPDDINSLDPKDHD